MLLYDRKVNPKKKENEEVPRERAKEGRTPPL